jgi:amino acid adenylation domain-containing protein
LVPARRDVARAGADRLVLANELCGGQVGSGRLLVKLAAPSAANDQVGRIFALLDIAPQVIYHTLWIYKNLHIRRIVFPLHRPPKAALAQSAAEPHLVFPIRPISSRVSMSDRVDVSPRDIASLVELLRWRSAQQADRAGYTLLVDGETSEAALTYRSLDLKARAIGAYLQGLIAPGERALLIFPPGLEYIASFFGCVYAGVIAVPTYLPSFTRPNQAFARLEAIVRDARPAVALIPSALRSSIDRLVEREPAFQALRWIETDTIPDAAADSWLAPALRAETLAFLQYTSGSTAAPKGVMLTHANLLHNLGLIQHAFAHSPDSRGVIWLPPYHDMGLIGGILQPLYAGFPVTLMSPVHFLQRPLRWLQAISRYGASTSGGPNFAYDLCVRKITPEQRATLDLSSWRVAFTGAEPIRAETLDRFAATFAPCGFRREAFYPCYGLAEATLIVAGGSVAAPPTIRAFDSDALEQDRVVEAESQQPRRALVGCGQALGDQQLVIVDPVAQTRREPGQIGEIWVAGPSVAEGYWDQPAESAAAFHGSLSGGAAGPFLRTGDLGFVQDGELFITGRLKDLIIIRGRNHYPQDIELTVEQSHASLRPGCGAAFAIERDGEERLVVVQEIERHERQPDVAAIAGTIRRAVIEQHELQVYAVVLLKPARLPKTSSGKIQRQQCRQDFLAGWLDAVGSSILDETQALDGDHSLSRAALLAVEPEARPELLAAYLRSSIAELLRVTPELVEAAPSISSLGLDSMMAIELRYRLERDLGVEIPLTAFLKEWNVAELARVLLEDIQTADHRPALPLSAHSSHSDRYPLSSAQAQFWFLEQIAPGSPAQVIAAAAEMRGRLDVAALQQSLNAIVERHAALRTTFGVIDGQPFQQIAPALPLLLSPVDLQALPASERMAEVEQRLRDESRHAFDLQHGPLLRATLLRLHPEGTRDEHVLLLVAHHSIADGWSMGLIFSELVTLYHAFSQQRPSPLADLPLQYVDFALWQRQWLASEAARAELAYWKAQLAGLPLLDLPTDRPRPATLRFNGAQHRFVLPQHLRQELERLSRREGVTLFTTLLAAFQVLLLRYSGQTDIVVGSPIAQRSHAALEQLVGTFANPLVLRGDLSGNPSVRGLLRRLWQVVLGAYEHQAFPFERLVEALQPRRDPSRHPLFQVAFVLQNMPLPEAQTPGLALRVLDIDRGAAQFDLKLELIPRQDQLVGWLEYNTDLFAAATIERMQQHLCILLEGFVAAPERPIGELPLLSAEEQRRILDDWNRTAADGPATACIHHVFEAQAARTPDRIALIFGEQTISYAELNRRANQLAHMLQALGAGPEMRVGILLERSPETIVAILGVLKAGAAYLPLDPAYPAGRLRFMLEDSRAGALVTQQRFSEIASMEPARRICLDQERSRIDAQPVHNPGSPVSAGNLAYMIYTSGSTGQPKGVLIEHGGVVNMAQAQAATFGVGAGARVLQFASLSFDASVFEIVLALLSGATLCLARSEELLPGPALNKLLHDQAISHATLTPSVLAALPAPRSRDELPALRAIIAAGEECSSEIVTRWAAGRAFFNAYGPTEATVWTTVAHGPLDGSKPPIGRPIANKQVYLLDAAQQLVPIGVAGEIYIGGAGMARGYLNRPDLTAERFVPDPFSKEPGLRLYRSGDLARYRADGQLEFLGRIDQQVKLRGFRIELGEIEATLAGHPAVREAAVLLREDRPGTQRLVAYVVPQDGMPAINELRAFLEERLPSSMVPAAIIALESLPLTTNGKLDRGALPAPDNERLAASASYVPPRTEQEAAIARIWSELLDLAAPGIHDNFFELGGHSLLIVQLQARLHERFGIQLAIVDLFQYPTIHLLAERLSQAATEQPTFQQSRAQAQSRKEAMLQQAQRRRMQREQGQSQE